MENQKKKQYYLSVYFPLLRLELMKNYNSVNELNLIKRQKPSEKERKDKKTKKSRSSSKPRVHLRQFDFRQQLAEENFIHVNNLIIFDVKNNDKCPSISLKIN